MTAEQAKAAAELMSTVWEAEFPATCQVLAAVKDDNRHYKPVRTWRASEARRLDPRVRARPARRQVGRDVGRRATHPFERLREPEQ